MRSIRNLVKILAISSTFIPLTAMALTCPSQTEVQNAYNANPQDPTITIQGFNQPFHLESVKPINNANDIGNFQNVQFDVNPDSSSMLYCAYKANNSDYPLLLSNTDSGPFVGTSGNWKTNSVKSNCDSNDANDCKFERKSN